MTIYEDLGLETIINAQGHKTKVGGSLMSPEVIDAMVAASHHFVPMHELHLAAGRRIAELIGVEAAHVCAGATAGIAVMAAACMAGSCREKISRLPDTTGMNYRFVVQKGHRDVFDQALRVAGGEFVEIGDDRGELKSALAAEGVAATYITISSRCRGAFSVREVAEMAHRVGIPVIVDAAAQLPPVENLTRFIEDGADLVAFSGGKAIQGPQATGFILGRTDLIKACAANDCPNLSIGRGMKTSKESIVGLVKAIELYVNQDFESQMAVWERRVAHVVEYLSDLEYVSVWRQMPDRVGHIIPFTVMTWDVEKVGLTPEGLVRTLEDGRPRIFVTLVTKNQYGPGRPTVTQVWIQPNTLSEGQEILIARRIRSIFQGA